MPLLPICIALSAVLAIIAVLLFVRRSLGRGVQVLGLAAVPMGLYLSGLLNLVVDAAKALWGWVRMITPGAAVTTGLGLLGLAIVLWLVGGWRARRRATKRAVERSQGNAAVTSTTSAPAAGTSGSARAKPAPKGKPQSDPEMDEIEALLRNRGIE